MNIRHFLASAYTRCIVTTVLVAAAGMGSCFAQNSATPSPAALNSVSSTVTEGTTCKEGQMAMASNGQLMQCMVGSSFHPILNVHATIYSGGKVIDEKTVEVADRTQSHVTGPGGDDNKLSYAITLTPILQSSGSVEVNVNMKLSELVDTRVVSIGNQTLQVPFTDMTCMIVEASTFALDAPYTFNADDAHPDQAFNSKVGADDGLPGCSIKLQIGMASVGNLTKKGR
jgi:hypothetical protein